MIDTRSSRYKVNACNTFRKVGLDVVSPDKEETAVSKVESRALKAYRTDPLMSFSEAKAKMRDEMAKLPTLSSTSYEARVKQAEQKLDRAYAFDSRKWNKAYPKIFRFGGEEIKARPDCWLETEIEVDGRYLPLIEVNTVSASKPYFGTTSRTGKDSSLYHNLIACGDLLYGKNLLGDREGIIRLEYDFLRTKEDKGGDFTKEFTESKPDKFSTSGSDNRAWIEVWFNEKGQILRKTRNSYFGNVGIFKNYRNSLEKFLAGTCKEDVTKGTCEKCSLYDRCRGYSKRPEPKPEQKVAGKVMTRDDFDISDEQRTVINFRKGVCCVDAGPGSGKTFSVSLRIADMIVDGSSPEDFMLLSFSKAAVAVMKQRVDYFLNEVYMMGIDISSMIISTFHSIGDELIKEHYKLLGYTKAPQLIDDIESIDLIRQAIDWENPIEGFDYVRPLMRLGTGGVIPKLEKIFKNIRDFNMDKKRFFEIYEIPDAEKIWASYERYVALMKAGNFIDYSDMANQVEKLIMSNQALVTDKYDYKHIIVDEFQDSNDFQMLLVNTLTCSDSFESLMVIGDEAQAIYGFRGCTPQNLVDFDTKMGISGVKDYTLTINRRSTPEIVDLSNRIIDINPGKHKIMTSANKSGEKPRFKGFETDKELEWIAEDIEKKIKGGVKPSDIVFIAHTKAKLQGLQGKLSEKGILALFDQPEEILSDSKVRAIISLVDFLRDSTSTKGVFDYLCEVWGNSFMDNPDASTIVKWEADNLIKLFTIPIDDRSSKAAVLNLIRAIDDGTDNLYKAFVERLEGKTSYNTFQLLNYIYKFRKYESTSTAEKDGEYEAVALVTAHSSKGKEWKHAYVSLSDFDSGLLRREDMPEKIRLAYVACTRAEETLTVTCLKYRKTEGDMKPINRFWSRFRVLEGFEDITELTPETLVS